MELWIIAGRYLFSNVVNSSYGIMFAINSTLLLVSIIYTAVRLKWRTTDRQKPLSEAPNLLLDYFDHNHAVETFRTMFKKRSFNRRTYLLLFIASMALYTFQREERSISYLYLQRALQWTFDQISYFRTYQSALQDIFLLVTVPFLSKFLGWRDTYIIMLGAICHSAARLFFALGRTVTIIYVGTYWNENV